jgi:hypothetical protein
VSLPIFMDHHVHAGITKGLRRCAINVLTTDEDGRAMAPDDQLLERATELGRPIFTQDDDFLEIADRWQQTGRHFAGVIYGHQLRVTVGQAVADIQLICEASAPEELYDTVIFLPL